MRPTSPTVLPSQKNLTKRIQLTYISKTMGLLYKRTNQNARSAITLNMGVLNLITVRLDFQPQECVV